ncbi:MAG: IclR family transcriptional regulator [Sphaerochaetaceae bacterium]|nr:IclR family transcriptional regulator [Sphaerochaetaceae bacterium]
MDKKTTEKNTEIIKMVDRALQVLDILRLSKESIGVNSIAKQCGINPSTAHRILKTLEVNGWVFQMGDGRYISGEKLSFVLGKDNLFIALQEVASIIMEKYTKKFNHAMNLIVREGSHCYILQQSRTNRLFDYIPPLHSELPFYACAGGKILLSELPINLADGIIHSREMVPLTKRTIVDVEVFWQELRKVAKQGYAIDNRESAENGSCIAVPVRDSKGVIIASLSFSGLIGIKEESELYQYIPELHEASSEITKNLYQCLE